MDYRKQPHRQLAVYLQHGIMNLRHPGRFDAPNAECGVIYVGADEHCAFIETFGYNTGLHRYPIATLVKQKLRGTSRKRCTEDAAGSQNACLVVYYQQTPSSR